MLNFTLIIISTAQKLLLPSTKEIFPTFCIPVILTATATIGLSPLWIHLVQLCVLAVTLLKPSEMTSVLQD